MFVDRLFRCSVRLIYPCHVDLGILLAPVCSTWTHMNSGTSGRCISNPLGRVDYASVAAANKMVSRVAILIWVACSLGVFFVLEQPAGSLLEYHPRMQDILKQFKIFRKTIWMSDDLLRVL